MKFLLCCAIAALSFELVACAFDQNECKVCVARECTYCGVDSIWDAPVNATVCHCGSFAGMYGDCRDYFVFAEDFNTNQECQEFVDAGEAWGGLGKEVEKGVRTFRRTMIIIFVLVTLAIAACVVGCVCCCLNRQQKQTPALAHHQPVIATPIAVEEGFPQPSAPTEQTSVDQQATIQAKPM